MCEVQKTPDEHAGRCSSAQDCRKRLIEGNRCHIDVRVLATSHKK